MPTIEERAVLLLNEVKAERLHPPIHSSLIDRDNCSFSEAICRAIEALVAERAAHAQFRQEVSDACINARYYAGDGPFLNVSEVKNILSHFIIAKPDPMMHLAREMVLLDGVVRTDNQKAAIREGRAANTAADDFYDRLRTALPARGLKLVEVGDAD